MKHFWGLSCSFDVCVQDNVFVTVVASVQFRAHVETAEDAFYKLTNPREQIKSYVFDGNFCNAGYGWDFFLGFFVVGRLLVFSILDSILPYIFLCMPRSTPKSCIVGASWLSKFLVSCCEKIVCFPILDFKQSQNESVLDCLFFDSIFPSIWFFMHVQEYSNYLL
jgi:hypothetical protein